MTNGADSRGVTMRISRKLRDIIHHVQRVQSVEQNRTLTVVEASDVVVEFLRKYPALRLPTQEDTQP